MSARVIDGPREARYRGLRISADEYLALSDDGFRYELVNGVVCLSPSPTFWHQELLVYLGGVLSAFVRKHDVGRVAAEVDVRMDDGNVYRPDIIYLSKTKGALVADKVIVPPDVVIEIVSPDSRGFDGQTKRADYERFGVGEYWIIDPREQRCTFLRHDGRAFAEVPPVADEFHSAAIPGFALSLAELRAMFR